MLMAEWCLMQLSTAAVCAPSQPTAASSGLPVQSLGSDRWAAQLQQARNAARNEACCLLTRRTAPSLCGMLAVHSAPGVRHAASVLDQKYARARCICELSLCCTMSYRPRHGAQLLQRAPQLLLASSDAAAPSPAAAIAGAAATGAHGSTGMMLPGSTARAVQARLLHEPCMHACFGSRRDV